MSLKDFIKEHKYVFIAIFIAWVIFFISTVGITSDVSFKLSPNMSIEKLGVFGDSFNVLTSLFTGLAFAGVIISVILQTKELKEARAEFKGQKEALQNQEFDNKFFQMLNLLNNITDNLTITSGSSIVQGKDIFRYLKNKFHNSILQAYNNDIVNSSVKDEKFIYFKNEFDQFNNEYDTTFKYYFINLYQILKYIDTYVKNKEEAKEYTNVLRAQLTKNELVLLAYNAIGVQSFTTNDYQKLVEKYGFFEHLRYGDFCDNSNLIEINTSVLAKYDDSVFGKNKALIEEIGKYRK